MNTLSISIGKRPYPFLLPHLLKHNRIILLILQIGYLYNLFSSNAEHVTPAANVGSHFIINNLLQFAFVMLWVTSHFWIAEIMLVLNFANLTSLYFRHSTTPRLIHIAVVSGPLAWNFVAIFWNGAAMVNAHNLPARILANIAIWGILGYGLFFLLAFKDYTMGFELSILSAGMLLFIEILVIVVDVAWQPLECTNSLSEPLPSSGSSPLPSWAHYLLPHLQSRFLASLVKN